MTREEFKRTDRHMRMIRHDDPIAFTRWLVEYGWRPADRIEQRGLADLHKRVSAGREKFATWLARAYRGRAAN